MSLVGVTVTVDAEPPLGVNETIKPEPKNPVPVKVKFPAVAFKIVPLMLSNVGVTVTTFTKAFRLKNFSDL